jgi:hypothetical protein
VLKLRAIKKFYNSFASANFLKSLFSVAVFKNCEERIKTAKKGGVGGGEESVLILSYISRNFLFPFLFAMIAFWVCFSLLICGKKGERESKKGKECLLQFVFKNFVLRRTREASFG